MSEKIFPECFGEDVFSETVAKESLPKAVFKSLKRTIDMGEPLSAEAADVIASAMKDWALSKGATHFTHWFQPMTGSTAEKHDSFLSPSGKGKAVAEFSGKELIQGEPDASSFPNGGIRATFEARGYTAWDCTSPAFIRDGSLCIPTVFISYTGEALDKKTPLLRSMDSLSEQAMRILRLFGNTSSYSVKTTVGPEQEYFLIDREDYLQRKDLIFTGRTLFGAPSPKGQELDDHYFGRIKPRIAAYMAEVDDELWKLGVTAKTKHNEVAPAQFEIAPIFETTNVATDHNQLVMDTLKTVAEKHGLACLLHEKPFKGLNGSGKHNNWSMATNDGINLLEPGTNPHENIQFLLFLTAVIKAVDTFPELLRLAASNSGNDHRLGANEAPPAIISIFLGDQLADLMKQIEEGSLEKSIQGGIIDLMVNHMPVLPKDNTDRNRTSPFAFTGNKFEFRMVASSLSISGPNIVLNAITTYVLKEFADRLEKAADFEGEVMKILREVATENKKVIFNGDGYSEEWVVEAEKRGLPNIPTYIEATKSFIEKKSVDMFEATGVFTENEVHARYEILVEQHALQLNIEAQTMSEMVRKQILPAAFGYVAEVAASIAAVKAACDAADVSAQEKVLTEASSLVAGLKNKVDGLDQAVADAAGIEDLYEKALCLRKEVVVLMDDLRETADALEAVTDSAIWPFPDYSDILFG